jgi:hypothetical protein
MNIFSVGSIDQRPPAQIPFGLRAFFGQDVAGISLVATDFPGAGFPEAFGRATVSLDFRHFLLL